MRTYCFIYTNENDFPIYADTSKELCDMLNSSGWDISHTSVMQYISRKKVTSKGYFDVFDDDYED